MLLQVHHNLSLNHVVIRLVQRNRLFKDRLLANAHQLAKHFHFYFAQSQSLMLSLCLLHGD